MNLHVYYPAKLTIKCFTPYIQQCQRLLLTNGLRPNLYLRIIIGAVTQSGQKMLYAFSHLKEPQQSHFARLCAPLKLKLFTTKVDCITLSEMEETYERKAKAHSACTSVYRACRNNYYKKLSISLSVVLFPSLLESIF